MKIKGKILIMLLIVSLFSSCSEKKKEYQIGTSQYYVSLTSEYIPSDDVYINENYKLETICDKVNPNNKIQVLKVKYSDLSEKDVSGSEFLKDIEKNIKDLSNKKIGVEAKIKEKIKIADIEATVLEIREKKSYTRNILFKEGEELSIIIVKSDNFVTLNNTFEEIKESFNRKQM